MKLTHSILAVAAVTIIAGFAPVLTASPAAAAKCVIAGGEATMVTQDLAKFMANAALGNSIKGKGLKPSGAVKMKCKDPSPLSYCIATQRACK